MIFQTLDDKRECAGIYYDGELHFNYSNLPAKLGGTWKYVPSLEGLRGVKYANLYVQKFDPSEVCPEHLRDDWTEVQEKMMNQHRAMKIAKVDLSSGCIWDMLPLTVLKEFCEVKNEITEYILNNYDKPKNYSHMLDISVMLQDIKQRKLNIDLSQLSTTDDLAQKFLTQVKSRARYIDYNQFGTKTGRLSTRKNSFPLLTMNKKFRSILRPNNDAFFELDFNGAELRVLLGLLGLDQPKNDVHDWNVSNVFANNLSRGEAKTAFFAWLYGSKDPKIRKYNKMLEQFYDKESLLDSYWDRKTVITEFGRTIEADEHHALNFIIQSTAADLTLMKAAKINNLLKERSSKSYVAFVVHDSIVVDISMEDKNLITEMKEIMSRTKWGEFGINASLGRHYGAMKKAK